MTRKVNIVITILLICILIFVLYSKRDNIKTEKINFNRNILQVLQVNKQE